MRDAAVIRNDLFDIAARLKSIDDGYFVVYNFRLHRYEVHHSRQRGSTFALSVPYPCLDVRTETLVRRTRAENAKRLMEETERENARIARLESEKALHRAQAAIEEGGRT